MSIEVVNTTINAPKKIVERTWRATQLTERGNPNDGADGISSYKNILYRERVTSIDGIEDIVSRDRVAPDPGPIADGTDGTQLEHYQNGIPGFEPKVEVKMTEVLSYPDSDTVTVGNVTVPVKIVPLLLSATYDLVAQKANQKALEKAIIEATKNVN